MKRCPKCNSTYSDETLSFCLSDGVALLEVDEQETEEFSTADRGEMRIEIPKETVAFQTPAPVTSVEPAKKRGVGAFLLGILAAMFLLVLVGVGGVAIYYFAFDHQNDQVANSATPTPSNEVESLKKELEELKGKVEEKEKETPAAQEEPTAEKTPKPTAAIPAGSAVVNSPSDGFLALRTLPNHKTGQRIAKIPHGTTINLSGCLRRIRIGKRTGSWCRTTYAGKTGWVFDAWVNRSG
ncbi:MAG: hypothetical protein OEQ28_05715 [Acidobacteriota bacterium]|nr:hypothetical protein [Acidobacteriota bacterium]